ncbi:hypothetical protein C8R45DRAFT_1091705 [Mycena sanguinolenta]|nr:hypothetical protein C8R45DRAFT_1091705 [Mycena sanguinolenta]
MRARAWEDEDSIARSTPGTLIVCWGPQFWIVLRGLLFSCSSVRSYGTWQYHSFVCGAESLTKQHAAFSCSATRLSQDAATTLDIFITGSAIPNYRYPLGAAAPLTPPAPRTRCTDARTASMIISSAPPQRWMSLSADCALDWDRG